MDVAQVFGGASLPSVSSEPRAQDEGSAKSGYPTVNVENEEYDPNDPGGWERTVTPAAVQAERRRSNYEKYSNFMMPVLKEEKTHRLYKMMKAKSMLKVRRVLSSYYMQDSPLVT